MKFEQNEIDPTLYRVDVEQIIKDWIEYFEKERFVPE
jgi:hypothetical protein